MLTQDSSKGGAVVITIILITLMLILIRCVIHTYIYSSRGVPHHRPQEKVDRELSERERERYTGR